MGLEDIQNRIDEGEAEGHHEAECGNADSAKDEHVAEHSAPRDLCHEPG